MASVHGTQSTGRAGLHEPLLQRSASTQALSRTDSQVSSKVHSASGAASSVHAGAQRCSLDRSSETLSFRCVDACCCSSLTQEEREEERALLLRRVQDPEWRLDRGAGYFAQERERNKRACLVQVGRWATGAREQAHVHTRSSPLRALQHRNKCGRCKRSFASAGVTGRAGAEPARAGTVYTHLAARVCPYVCAGMQAGRVSRSQASARCVCSATR